VRTLAYIICGAALLRLAMPLIALTLYGDFTVLTEQDTGTYFAGAQSLAESGRFLNTNGEPEIIRTPGYPLFLVPGIWLRAPYLWAITLQIALSLLTIWLVFRLAREISPLKMPNAANEAPASPSLGPPSSSFAPSAINPALIAALFYAIEPLSIAYSSVLLSETLFTALLTAHLYALVLFLKGRRSSRLILAAAALSAAAFVRPAAYFLPFVETAVLASAWLFQFLKNRKLQIANRKSLSLPLILLFFSLSLSPLLLWQARNRAETGYGGFSAIADHNLYYYQASAVLARIESRRLEDVQAELEQACLARHPDQRFLTAAERLRSMGKEGRRVILDHPLVYARIHLAGMARTLIDPGSKPFLCVFNAGGPGGLLNEIVDNGLWAGVKTVAGRPAALWSNLVLGALLLALLFLAAIFLARIVLDRAGMGLPVWLLLAVAAYLLLISGGPFGIGRFRHPIMPIICILAGYGAAGLLKRKREAENE
jgi:hypothetical protein